jgi:hypothetical protein
LALFKDKAKETFVILNASFLLALTEEIFTEAFQELM